MDTTTTLTPLAPAQNGHRTDMPRALWRPPALRYNVPQNAYTRYFKRVLDVTLALIAAGCLLSWMIPVLFILIRSTSSGSLFFVQARVGLNGRIFRCLKFRTMLLNEGSDTRQSDHDDQRVTRIGKWLRLTHIDELPQVLNVLMNDMSIVGPRPHMLYHDHLFSDAVADYPYRHLLKPGITGLAQSRGYHGATPDLRSISSRTRLDLFYVQQVSFLLDLQILLRTLFRSPYNRLAQ